MNALEKFRKMAIPAEIREEKELTGEFDALAQARDRLYGIEAMTTQRIDDRIAKNLSERKLATKGYQRLSLEPLGWLRGIMNVRPVFAIYSIDEATMSMSGEGIGRPRNLPPEIREAFADTSTFLSRNQAIHSTFQGVVPEHVRKEIEEAKPFFGEKLDHGQHLTHIYFISEVKKWKTEAVSKPTPIPGVDPLVVGWDAQAKEMWLITHFDLTDLERYMIDEFPGLMNIPDIPMLGA